jgi:hypothetical protein
VAFEQRGEHVRAVGLGDAVLAPFCVVFAIRGSSGAKRAAAANSGRDVSSRHFVPRVSAPGPVTSLGPGALRA